jgi:hypothetical protein
VDRLAQAYVSFPLLFWLLCSVLAYGVGTNLLWLGTHRRLHHSTPVRFLAEVGRFVYFLGIPYLALGGWPRRPFEGLLSPANMGLVGLSAGWTLIRWLQAAGTAFGVGLVASLVLALAWNSAQRSVVGARRRFPPRPWWLLVVDVLYLQVHWAFYWGAFRVVLDDVYAAVVLGLILIYLEWSLNPLWRRGWRLEPRAVAQWWRAAWALVTAMIFLLTRNLWVCLVVHWLVELTFWLLGRARAAVSEEQKVST